MSEAYNSVEHALLLSEVREAVLENIGYAAIGALPLLLSKQGGPTTLNLIGDAATDYEDARVQIYEMLHPTRKVDYLMRVASLEDPSDINVYVLDDERISQHGDEEPADGRTVEYLRYVLSRTTWIDYEEQA